MYMYMRSPVNSSFTFTYMAIFPINKLLKNPENRILGLYVFVAASKIVCTENTL